MNAFYFIRSAAQLKGDYFVFCGFHLHVPTFPKSPQFQRKQRKWLHTLLFFMWPCCVPVDWSHRQCTESSLSLLVLLWTHLEVSVNNVLLVAVLHRRYDLYEEEDKQSLVKCLVFSSQTVIKDVVEEEGEEGEEKMWLTATGKIKHNLGVAEDTSRVRESRFPLWSQTTVHSSLSQFRSQMIWRVQRLPTFRNINFLYLAFVLLLIGFFCSVCYCGAIIPFILCSIIVWCCRRCFQIYTAAESFIKVELRKLNKRNFLQYLLASFLFDPARTTDAS